MVLSSPWVTIVTRARIGGSLPKPAAVAERIAADTRRLAGRDAAVLETTTCLGLYEGEGVVAALAPDGPVAIRPHRLIVATGAYDRPLLVPGNDLPGVIGLRAFELLAAQHAFATGTTIGVFGAASETARALRSAERLGVPIAWAATSEPTADAGSPIEAARSLVAIAGRRGVRNVLLDGGDRRSADVLVLGFTQPTYEVQLHNGQTATLSGAPPVVTTGGPSLMPMLVVGEATGPIDPAAAQDRAAVVAAAWSSGTDDRDAVRAPAPSSLGPIASDAIVCTCEDVRVRDLDRAIAEGFDHVELVKRRSGAGTGACQGKLCLGLIGEVLAARGLSAALPTIRPPIRPVRVAALGGGP